VYREACRELTAPEDKIEEIIAMTEHTNKKVRRPLRTALICAAAVSMMVVSVAAANPEGFQAILTEVAGYIQIDDYRSELTMENGDQVTVFVIPEAAVEERGGRAVLVIDGEAVADVTDALNQEGRYEEDIETEKNRMHITVEGTVEDWLVTLSIDSPDGEAPFVITTDSKGHKMSEAPATSYDDDLGVSAYDYNGETLEIITKP